MIESYRVVFYENVLMVDGGDGNTRDMSRMVGDGTGMASLNPG
jgi:hypothetical protein